MNTLTSKSTVDKHSRKVPRLRSKSCVSESHSSLLALSALLLLDKLVSTASAASKNFSEASLRHTRRLSSRDICINCYQKPATDITFNFLVTHGVQYLSTIRFEEMHLLAPKLFITFKLTKKLLMCKYVTCHTHCTRRQPSSSQSGSWAK